MLGDENLFIASLTVAELRRRIPEKPNVTRRVTLDKWFSRPEGLQARLMAEGRKAGQPHNGLDKASLFSAGGTGRHFQTASAAGPH